MIVSKILFNDSIYVLKYLSLKKANLMVIWEGYNNYIFYFYFLMYYSLYSITSLKELSIISSIFLVKHTNVF